MNDNPEPPAKPENFHVVLEPLQISPEARARSIRWLLIKEAMRRQPQPRRTYTMSFSDQPDFFIVDEQGKG